MKSIFDTTFINATNYNWFFKLFGGEDTYITYQDFMKYCKKEAAHMSTQYKKLKPIFYELRFFEISGLHNSIPRMFIYNNRNIFYFIYQYKEFSNERT